MHSIWQHCRCCSQGGGISSRHSNSRTACILLLAVMLGLPQLGQSTQRLSNFTENADSSACEAMLKFATNPPFHLVTRQCKDLTCYLPQYNSASNFNLTLPKSLDLRNRHIFLWGDSTTRQLWNSLMALLGSDGAAGFVAGLQFQQVREYVRTKCEPQERTPHHVPWVHDGSICHTNERVCKHSLNSTILGDNLRVTFEWKHLAYEDYDRAIMDDWKSGKQPVPDLIIVGPGLHDCTHFPDQATWHMRQLELFALHLKNAVPNATVVWFDTVPFTKHRMTMPCVATINQFAIQEAARHGFLYFGRYHYLATHPHVNYLTHNGHYDHFLYDEMMKLMLNYLACKGFATRGSPDKDVGASDKVVV